MDTPQWPKGIGLVKPMGELVSSSTTTTAAAAAAAAAANNNNYKHTNTGPQVMERKGKPEKEKALSCPRCNSGNTKFCYYNNYSLTQPRYFCKTCRRYWTQGGTLRNVPVGGGSRKNKRPSASTASTSSMKLPNPQNSTSHQVDRLNLVFPSDTAAGFGAYSSLETNPSWTNITNSNINSSDGTGGGGGGNGIAALSAMELFKNGVLGRGVSPFMPMAMPMHPSGFGLQDFRSSSMISTSPMNGMKMLFPFEDLSNISSGPSDSQQHGVQGGDDHAMLWNGVIGGHGGEGSW